jgi:hypothetical protein
MCNHKKCVFYDIKLFYREIDGVIYPGVVRDRNIARKQYETAKEKGETTGLVSQE